MDGYRKARLALTLAVLPIAMSCGGGGGGGGGGGFNVVPSSAPIYVGKAVRFTAEGLQDGNVVEWTLTPPSAGTIIPLANNQCKFIANATAATGTILRATVTGTTLTDTATINTFPLAYTATFPIVREGTNANVVGGDIDFGNGRVYVAHNDSLAGNFIYRYVVGPADPRDPPEASFDASQSSNPPQPLVNELAASTDGSVYYVTNTGLLRRLLSNFSGNDPSFNPIVAFYSGPVAVDASGIIHAATSGGLVLKMTSNGTSAGSFTLPVGFNPVAMSFDEDGAIVMGGGTSLRKFLANGVEDPNFTLSGVTFTDIVDVDTDSEGAIYVIDAASPTRIVHVNAVGQFIQAYTAVEVPLGVAADFLGTLWILDDTDEGAVTLVPPATVASAIRKLTPI